MKANELRIGNLVTDSIGIVEIGKNAKIEFSDIYNPIKLTEDILLKCGFSNGKQINKKYFKHIGIPGGIFLGNNYANYKYTNIIIEINSLHQVQNFYFALTGNELNVTKLTS